MSKVTIAGNVFVITSAYTLEELKRIERFRPDALVQKNADGEPVFAVSTGCVGGLMSEAVVFADSTRDGEKKACITCKLPNIPEGKDARDVLADEIGGVIARLNEIEAGLPATIEAINAEHAAAVAEITVA